MLLDLGSLIEQYLLNITGIVHVGAHTGEEAELYAMLGIEKVIWIEANPQIMDKLHDHLLPYHRRFPQWQLFQALVLDEPKMDVPFNITNYDGMSSSVYPWGTHTQFSPDTVVVDQIKLNAVTLDDLHSIYDFSGCNFFNIDIEGAGLDALKGATKLLLAQMAYVYLEVQTDNVYDGAPCLPEVQAWLNGHLFRLVEQGMVPGQGWGDALFMKWPKRGN